MEGLSIQIKPNNIYCMDNMKGMSYTDYDSVDLCVTSPPYNLGNKKVKYKTHDDNMTSGEYMHYLRIRFEMLYHIMKDDGRVCINTGDHNNGKIPMHSYFITMMEKIGFKVFTTIIWNKKHAHSRTSWGSFMSASCPSFPHTHEYIVVFYKDSLKKLNPGVSTIAKQDFIDWSMPIWTFPPESGMKKKWNHEAVFPEELPRRCIEIFTYENDLVIDIFSGVGTTCAVAKKLNRQYIGFETDPDDVEVSKQRLSARGIF